MRSVNSHQIITDWACPWMMNSGIADVSAVAQGLPVRRMGRREEVALAVLWLASDAPSFVVGHNLCVDGGFLAS
jgi:NAD(P)-dependent dehydrogenase (short-subunit alcohol dehydrogenase family)